LAINWEPVSGSTSVTVRPPTIRMRRPPDGGFGGGVAASGVLRPLLYTVRGSVATAAAAGAAPTAIAATVAMAATARVRIEAMAAATAAGEWG